MGNITESNKRILEASDDLDLSRLEGLIDDYTLFADSLNALLDRRCKEPSPDGKKMTREKIYARAHMSRTRITEILNAYRSSSNTKHYKIPSREAVLDICLAADASLDETNNILKLAGYAELYPRKRMDSIIYRGLYTNQTTDEIRRQLILAGFNDFTRDDM